MANINKKNSREFDLVIYGATGYVLILLYLPIDGLDMRAQTLQSHTNFLHILFRFTGSLACNYVAKQYKGKGLKWCIAGRSREKLEKLAEANGNPSIYVAEADNEAALNLMCAKTKAVAACAGPFSRYGKKLVAACVNQGTDYCDITVLTQRQ
jgi:short subunit dehydrogenase-like uncharacterized protein